MAAVLSGLRRGLRVGRATLPAGRLPQRRALSLPPPPPLPVLAIVGTPNAGKSTLFNRLVGPAQLTARAFRPRALVAPLAGTTRDRLEGEGEWLGYRFLVVDTGGIEDLWPLRAEEELARRTRRRGGGHGQGRRGRAHARRVAAGEEAGLSDEPSLDVGEAGAAGGSPSGWVGSAGAVVPPSLSPPPVSPLAAPPFAFPSAPRTEEEAEASRLRLAAAVEAQVATAVKQAAVVLFLVDARAGITAGTDRLAARLRRVAAEGGARVLVVANKCESVGAEMEAHELWGLGLGEPRAVSGLHGRGVGELLDLVVGELKEWEGKRRVQGGGGGGLGVLGEGGDGGGEVEGGSDGKGTPEGRGGHLSTHTGTEEQGRVGTATEAGTQPDALSSEDAEWGEEEGEAGEQGLAAGAPPSSVRPRPSPGWSGASSVGKVALIGRPNVGKSSLLNRLLGRERAVVDSIPGTTRDSIAEGYEWRGNKLLLLDTAGIRKPQVRGGGGGDVHSRSVHSRNVSQSAGSQRRDIHESGRRTPSLSLQSLPFPPLPPASPPPSPPQAGGASRDDLDRASVSAARTALGQCHVALLLLDASHGITRADMAIAGLLTDQVKRK
jgi:predicted GTPase